MDPIVRINELESQLMDLRNRYQNTYAALSKIAYMGKRYNVFSERKTMREIARACLHEVSKT